MSKDDIKGSTLLHQWPALLRRCLSTLHPFPLPKQNSLADVHSQRLKEQERQGDVVSTSPLPATYIATPSATAVTFFAFTKFDTHNRPFAGATTSKTGTLSLAVALWAQNVVWHCCFLRRVLAQETKRLRENRRRTAVHASPESV